MSVVSLGHSRLETLTYLTCILGFIAQLSQFAN